MEDVDKKCKECGGTGGVTCYRCHGSGHIGILHKKCPQCGGTGSHHCPVCTGTGKKI